MSGDRIIAGDGTPERDWRSCARLAAIEPIDAGTLLPTGARLVVVAPHPDDEVLACGGLLAAHAARGGRSRVVGVSDGEASHAGCDGWDATQLGASRQAERRAGLQRLGLETPQVIRLGIADGRIAAHVQALARELEALLDPDDVVVTTWRFDGHPDHEACAEAATLACAARGCRLLQAPVWMWHWARPGDDRVPWQRLRALRLDPDALARKRHALLAHATQLAPRDPSTGPVLPRSCLDRLERRVEYLFVEAAQRP